MQLTDFTFRIILIFIPGLISFFIIESLAIYSKLKIYHVIFYSLILGFICYFCYLPFSLIPGLEFSFIKSLSSQNTELNFWEILIATILAIPIGMGLSYAINKKILFKIANKYDISKKTGDIDIWSQVMNLETANWVVVRDLKNEITYEGWISGFSDNGENHELLICDAKIYNSADPNKELYEVPGLYLNRKIETLDIEFPNLKSDEYNKKNTKTKNILNLFKRRNKNGKN